MDVVTQTGAYPDEPFGRVTTPATDPVYYTPPGGDSWRVYNVRMSNGRIVRAAGRRAAEATHRVFVHADGRQLYVPLTDIQSRGYAERMLYAQFRAAVPRAEP
jgi:hypothetical protein